MADTHSFASQAGRTLAPPARKPGNWKLAYADFLTALCAFFLVMWIVHGVSAEERAELARQFGADAETQLSAIAPPSNNNREADLASAISRDERLTAFGASVTVTAEAGKVRIDLTDMAVRPLFETGEGRLNATGGQLVAGVGAVLSLFPGDLTIEGHTDSFPSLRQGYSNWELSADRANSARRILERSGIEPQRIQAVTGLADTKPIRIGAPDLPANRRISIVLHLDMEPTQ